MLYRYFKKALFKGAFFTLAIIAFNSAYAFSSCTLNTKESVEAAIVKWVYDGDTLLVTDLEGDNERKIRIIGIDTPEVKHHQQKDQHYGPKAREELRVLLKDVNNQILLEFDKEKYEQLTKEGFVFEILMTA